MAMRMVLPPYSPACIHILPVYPPCILHSSRRHSVTWPMSLKILNSSFSQGTPPTEADFLRAVSESEGDKLPCVRSYENDLSRLTLVGAVDSQQAITAGAADGGGSASEHLRDGAQTMVAEAIFLGSLDDNSTISTRLFLPAKKVMEKGNRLRSSIPHDILSNTTSGQILSMTFRQVVLRQVWSFELEIFEPGSERNMMDLGCEREVPVSFSIKSANECIISVLAEVMCSFVLESTRKKFQGTSPGKTSFNIPWLKRRKCIISNNSSVILYELEDEVVEDMNNLICKFQSMERDKPVDKKRSASWLALSCSSKFEQAGGVHFRMWVAEHVPLYKLQIDAKLAKNMKLGGWFKSAEQKWDVLLTHSQLVALAGILDIYFEDNFTFPHKSFSANLVADFGDLSGTKKSHSIIKLLCSLLAMGIFLIAFGTTGRHAFPHLFSGRARISSAESSNSSLSAMGYPRVYLIDACEVEPFCSLVIQKIKDGFGWQGEVVSDSSIGSWIGPLPYYLNIETQAAMFVEGDTSPKLAADDIASYQVTLARDGRVMGFQPTNRIAVKHWASNPLAKELHCQKQLSPGLVELGLKFHRTKEIVVMEMVVSVNPEIPFSLARPSLLKNSSA